MTRGTVLAAAAAGTFAALAGLPRAVEAKQCTQWVPNSSGGKSLTMLNPCYEVGETFDAEDSAYEWTYCQGDSTGQTMSINSITAQGKILIMERTSST